MDERPQPPLATEADYGAPPTTPVGNPEDFGVPEVQDNGEAAPKSNFTVPSTPVDIPSSNYAAAQADGGRNKPIKADKGCEEIGPANLTQG